VLIRDRAERDRGRDCVCRGEQGGPWVMGRTANGMNRRISSFVASVDPVALNSNASPDFFLEHLSKASEPG